MTLVSWLPLSTYFFRRYIGHSLKVKGPKHSQGVFQNKDGQHILLIQLNTEQTTTQEYMHPPQQYHKSDDCNLSLFFLSMFLVRKCLVYSSHVRVLQWKCCQWKLLFSSFAKNSYLFNVKFNSVLNIKISTRQEHSTCNTSYIFYDN